MAVYFIQNMDTGDIKIGKSFMVPDRMKILARQEGAPLRLLGVIKGYSTEEADLHKFFIEIRLHGEWFENHTDLIEFIETHAIPLEDLDETPPAPTGPRIVAKSNIKKLAAKQEITTPSHLAHAAWVAWNTAKKMLQSDADLSSVPLETLLKVAVLFNCKIDDLFEVR